MTELVSFYDLLHFTWTTQLMGACGNAVTGITFILHGRNIAFTYGEGIVTTKSFFRFVINRFAEITFHL